MHTGGDGSVDLRERVALTARAPLDTNTQRAHRLVEERRSPQQTETLPLTSKQAPCKPTDLSAPPQPVFHQKQELGF